MSKHSTGQSKLFIDCIKWTYHVKNPVFQSSTERLPWDIYPDNKISNFKVYLANPLQLDSAKWEVGLSEIQFPHLWYNIREGKNIIEKEILNLTVDELNYLYPIEKGKYVQQKQRNDGN